MVKKSLVISSFIQTTSGAVSDLHSIKNFDSDEHSLIARNETACIQLFLTGSWNVKIAKTLCCVINWCIMF